MVGGCSETVGIANLASLDCQPQHITALWGFRSARSWMPVLGFAYTLAAAAEGRCAAAC